MIYKVEFTKGARKLFRKLPQELQDRIQSKIDDLAIEPRPDGVKKLQGEEKRKWLLLRLFALIPVRTAKSWFLT